MILYFSGTGNTRYCAKMLADLLQEECVDVFRFLRAGSPAEFSSEKPWVFVSPTYCWQLPRVFQEFLSSGRFSGSQDAYFVMTCGGEIGNSAVKNQALCETMGLRYHGTLPVVMPDNYIVMFRAPAASEAQKIIGKARPTLEQGAALIQEGHDFPPAKAGLLDKTKSGIVNTLFYRCYIKAKPFTATSACIGCGKCETVCPLGNIQMRNGKPVWGNHCTHCMACICTCPTEAIEYGKATRGKVRYQCPDYKG